MNTDEIREMAVQRIRELTKMPQKPEIEDPCERCGRKPVEYEGTRPMKIRDWVYRDLIDIRCCRECYDKHWRRGR